MGAGLRRWAEPGCRKWAPAPGPGRVGRPGRKGDGHGPHPSAGSLVNEGVQKAPEAGATWSTAQSQSGRCNGGAGAVPCFHLSPAAPPLGRQEIQLVQCLRAPPSVTPHLSAHIMGTPSTPAAKDPRFLEPGLQPPPQDLGTASCSLCPQGSQLTPSLQTPGHPPAVSGAPSLLHLLSSLPIPWSPAGPGAVTQPSPSSGWCPVPCTVSPQGRGCSLHWHCPQKGLREGSRNQQMSHTSFPP